MEQKKAIFMGPMPNMQRQDPNKGVRGHSPRKIPPLLP